MTDDAIKDNEDMFIVVTLRPNGAGASVDRLTKAQLVEKLGCRWQHFEAVPWDKDAFFDPSDPRHAHVKLLEEGVFILKGDVVVPIGEPKTKEVAR